MSDTFFNENFSKTIVNINGIISEAKDAKVSIFDRGFLYGDSIYEVTYGKDNSLIFLEEHINRLFNSAKLLSMKIFFKKEEIIQEILKTLAHTKLKDVYIRIILTRGETAITLDPNSSFRNNLIIIARPKAFHPKKNYENGISLYIPGILRNDIKSVNPNAKSGNYLNNVMAMSEAKEYGADDAVMINHDNEVTEGTTFNIWMVRDGTLFTPPITSGLLKGITRDKIIELCSENNLSLQVIKFGKQDLLDAQEVFITSSTRGVMPVNKVNEKEYGKSIKDWPITRNMMNLYAKKVEQEKDELKYLY
jgi:branched-chain amino acid aminotransferase